MANCTACSILWVDTSKQLTATQLVAFGGQGLAIKQLTLSELSNHTLASAEVVVIRPIQGLIELEQLKALIKDLAFAPTIVVRLGFDQFEQGIEAMKLGVGTVVLDQKTAAGRLLKANRQGIQASCFVERN